MLSNINSEKDLLLQVILVGQPPLRELLQHPELEQFAQRVAVDYHLDGLSSEETRGYIRHRLRVAGGEHELFTDDACDAVFAHSGGIPRLINLLCDLALVYAYAGQAAVVTGELIEQIVSEREQHGALPVFAVSPELRTVQRLTLKQAQGSAAVNMAEAVATHGARHAATPRLVGEADRVPATEEKIIASRPGTDSTKARVHAVRSVPASEEQQPEAIPESGTPEMNPAATTDDAEITPAPVATTADASHDARVANTASDALPVPFMPAPTRRAADSGVRVWRYIAAGVLVLLVSAGVLVWQFLDRSDLKLATRDRPSPARVTTVQTPAQKPVGIAPANAPFPAARPVPAASPMPQALAASPVPGKDAAEEARLNQIRRERDAALAAAEAAARERESLRNAALARERALAAEHAAAVTRERERAKQLAQAAELAILQAHEAELAAEAKAAEPAASTSEVKAGEAPVIQATGIGISSQDAGVEAVAEVSDTEAAAAFTTNPCKGPSARFLSTCE
jgi:hypothetical protein